MVDVDQHVSLDLDVIFLFFLLYLLLLQHLHGVKLSCVDILHEKDFRIRAFSNYGNDAVVVDGFLLLRFLH